MLKTAPTSSADSLNQMGLSLAFLTPAMKRDYDRDFGEF